MDFKDYYAFIEVNHEIQNPTLAEKLGLLAVYCAIADGTRILDVGCGKAWLLRTVARTKAVQAVGIEINPTYVQHARQAMVREPVKGSVELLEMPALSFQGKPASFDVTLCIGASFALGTFQTAVDWLAQMTMPGGHLAIGEPYARKQPFPDTMRVGFADAERSLAQTVAHLERRGLSLIGLIDASLDDWDRYESLHWHTAHAWARAHSSHPDSATVINWIEMRKHQYLECERDYLGWAIFVCRVP